MNARLRRGLAAVGLGIAVGAAAAVVIPSAESTPTERPFLAPTAPLTRAAPTKADLGPETDSSIYLRVHPGTLHQEMRRRDPAGGPDWIIRVYEADRMIPPPIRRPGSDGVASVALCAQLGRVVDGRFGWIDGDNVFRPVSTRSFTGLPALCTSRILDRRHDPEVQSATLVDSPKATDPVIRGAVVWGLVGAKVRSAEIDTAGRRRVPQRSKGHGAFLEFFGPSHSTVDVSARVRYADGHLTDTSVPQAGPAGFAPKGYSPSKDDPIDRSSQQVIARTFDPGGGPSWAENGVQTKSGMWCVGNTGRLVGDRIGEVDAQRGTLLEQPPGNGPNGCGTRAQPTKQRPVQLVSGGGSYTDVPELDGGRGALRLQKGSTILWGRTLPSVDLLTIQSPRDVRAIEPSGPAHGFIVVYDGTFASGSAKVTAHFKDGHSKTLSMPLGMG